LSKRVRRAFAALSVPAGLTLALFAVPGPCTTFDSVDAATLSEAEPRCDASLQLVFETEAEQSACEAFLSTTCCGAQHDCLASDACVSFVDCVNRCPSPRKLECTGACGTGVGRNPVTDFGKCEAEAGMGNDAIAGCRWFPD
jgi:hypothetical protein